MYKATYVMPASGLSINMKTGETKEAGEELNTSSEMEKFYGIVRAIGMPLPKTRDATYLLRKKVTVRGKNMTMSSAFLEDEASASELLEAKAMEDYDNRHSVAYIVGSSLAFEVFILGIACFIFVHKDF